MLPSPNAIVAGGEMAPSPKEAETTRLLISLERFSRPQVSRIRGYRCN
jgi:hypothetical protein